MWKLLALTYLASNFSYAQSAGLQALQVCGQKIDKSPLLLEADKKIMEAAKLGQMADANVQKVKGQAQPDSFCAAARESVDGFVGASDAATSAIGKAIPAVETLFSKNDDCIKRMESQKKAAYDAIDHLNKIYGAQTACKKFPLKNRHAQPIVLMN